MPAKARTGPGATPKPATKTSASYDPAAVTAMNKLAGEALVEHYLHSAAGRASLIHQSFADLERDFVAARTRAKEPDSTHDEIILRLYRDEMARSLARRFPSFRDLIWRRARLPITLPDVPPRQPETPLERAVEAVFEADGGGSDV